MRLLIVKPNRILVDQLGVPVDQIYPNDVIYFVDWYSRQWLEHTMAGLGKPSLIICDVESSLTPQPVPVVFIPALCSGIFQHLRPSLKAAVDMHSISVKTSSCFNFSINKKSIDRYLLLKIIQWFKLNSYQYTWSGSGTVMDLLPVLTELSTWNSTPKWFTSEFQAHILSGITGIDPLWHTFDDTVGFHNHHQTTFSGQPTDQWVSFKRDLIESTAVSILCDSSTDLEPNFTITERLLYYIAGLNFAIFAGNYGQAEQLQRMGIDTFPDIIDHSYQWHQTLLERTYYAIHDNLKILSDIDHARQTRSDMISRLIQNRNYVLGSDFDQWLDSQYQLLPADVNTAVTEFSQAHRPG